MARRAALLFAVVGCGDNLAGPDARIDSPPRPDAACDVTPSGVDREDVFIDFKTSGMVDPMLDNLDAKLHVRVVTPRYDRGKCDSVPSVAAVLIHGRSLGGPPSFDLQHTGPEGSLSTAEAMARAGIATYIPNMLGYGKSSRFTLDDPFNASLPGATAGVCLPTLPACDISNNPGLNPLDQQGRAGNSSLRVNPLNGVYHAHTSRLNARGNGAFGNTDVWARDIERVIDLAIARESPTSGKVTLVGYSFGAQRVGRMADKTHYDITAKVEKLAFLAPLFLAANGMQQPREEPANGPFPTFPLTFIDRTAAGGGWTLSGDQDLCGDLALPGTKDELWEQSLAEDAIGATWGGTTAGSPTGLLRSPTFMTYGFNSDVAAMIDLPTLVLQGLQDAGMPPGAPGHTHSCELYRSIPATNTNKLLLQVSCASHGLFTLGCDPTKPRCQGAAGVTPYGQAIGEAWNGPRTTVSTALVEFITAGTFTVPGAAASPSGTFTIAPDGSASSGTPACP